MAAQESGPVDILINNAGIVTGEYLLDATDEAIERTIQVNTLALFGSPELSWAT
ncbi:SDR family NAD(P)-dependent oxidoreductase [Ornithinimicrobium sp. INDO-MA30-4]|nr:SDR family NAD(P)-dependent oxidoreductase [Ornithinimicrobium sp. INDO-MA30-4]UJH70945.1 SDR family NAD(P)-dependent oxidoreductase [Ornithinimicrobium sp. INDO-MA30-4]